MLQEKIKILSKKYAAEFIEVRRYLHAHPELSYKEFETSAFIQKKLSGWNIPFKIKATTGVEAIMQGLQYPVPAFLQVAPKPLQRRVSSLH